MDITKTHIHDRWLSWFCTGTLIEKSGGIKVVLWAHASPLIEIMR